MSEATIDQAIVEKILYRNLNLLMMALEDGAAWREELDEEEAAEAYARLRSELEEWIYE